MYVSLLILEPCSQEMESMHIHTAVVDSDEAAADIFDEGPEMEIVMSDKETRKEERRARRRSASDAKQQREQDREGEYVSKPCLRFRY